MSIHFLESIGRSSSPKESEISLIVLEGFLASSLFLICTPVTLSTIGFLIAKYFTSTTIKVSEILLFLYSWLCIFDNYSSLDRRCRFSLFLAVTLSTTVHHFLNIRQLRSISLKIKIFFFVPILFAVYRFNLKKSNLKVERNFCVRIRRLLHIFERTVIRLTKSNPISNKQPS